MTAFHLPDGVLGMAERGADWADWVDRMPGIAEALLDEWDLRPDGWSMHGYTSIVIPVTQEGGAGAVLKITFDGDDESAFEHLALRAWDGDGAVRLLAADPHRRALLLERAEAEDLRDLWDVEACEVVAGLYAKLHRPALPQLATLTSYVARWLDDLEALGREVPIPPRIVEQALHLGRALCSDEASTGTTIHGDLHYFNVLRTGRGWVAIDPKPMSGDPHYELAPMLWNRWEELTAPVAVGSLRDGIRRRFHTLVDTAGLDEHRARDWVVVRMLDNALWCLQDGPGEEGPEAMADHLTMCIAIAKAVQD